MPHKYNADRRRHIPWPKRRVTNWSAYNEALRQRGSLTVWFTDDAIAAWKAMPRTKPELWRKLGDDEVRKVAYRGRCLTPA